MYLFNERNTLGRGLCPNSCDKSAKKPRTPAPQAKSGEAIRASNWKRNATSDVSTRRRASGPVSSNMRLAAPCSGSRRLPRRQGGRGMYRGAGTRWRFLCGGEDDWGAAQGRDRVLKTGLPFGRRWVTRRGATGWRKRRAKTRTLGGQSRDRAGA